MQYRPYPIPWEEAVRFFGLPTDLAADPGDLAAEQLVLLPRSHDVEGTVGDAPQPMPGDGYKPYGNALDFGVLVRHPSPGVTVLRVTVWQVVAGTYNRLMVYSVPVPFAPTPVFLSVVAFSGFEADAWDLRATSLDHDCTVTVFGFAGWVPGLRIARGPGVLPVIEPSIA